MLSIIIPTLNEEKALPETLRKLFTQVSDEEIIVVDGGSTDDTQSICNKYPQIKFLHSVKGRATQMNKAAKIAQGDTLLFLHADTQLPENALSTIKNTMQQQHIAAGGFKHSFGDNDWRLKFISFLDNRRCIKTRIIYGDQAMFIRSDLFRKLRGFPDVAIMEDIYFCEMLVNHTKPAILDVEIKTDPRKFIQMGIWRSLYRVMVIQLRNEIGLPVANDYPFFSEVR